MRLIQWICIAALCACSVKTQPTEVHQPRTTESGPVVFIGDSITMLWPLDSYLTGAVNLGVSGNETGQMLARIDDAFAKNPSVIVILGGTNDIRNRDSADPEHLFDMIQQAKDRNIRVIVGTIPPMDINLGAYPDIERRLIPVLNDKIVKGATKYGYDVADYHSAMILGDGSLDRSLYVDAYLHPNRAGYDAMWNVLQPVLSQLTH